jgi:hypothetical protein
MWRWPGEFLNAIFAPIFLVLSKLDPAVQGIVLGLPVALLALLIYRFASNQQAITRTKDQITGQLLALRLFRDDFRIVLGAQGRIFRLVVRYLRLALLPMAILLVPVVLLLVQVESRFALRPLAVGESALIAVEIDSVPPSQVDASVSASAGARVETEGLRLDSERQILWRLIASEAGPHLVSVSVGEETQQRRLWVGTQRPQLMDSTVYRANDVRSLLGAADEPMPAESIVVRTTISYPEASGTFAGLSSVTWLMFVSSLVFGFLLRRPLNVDF